MTASPPNSRCSARWISRPHPDDAAQPARARLHVRVPADPRRALQRAQRQRGGRRLRPEHPLRPVLHARDRDLQPRHRVLHDAGPRPRDRARPGPAQARARHAAADGHLPRLVGDGRGGHRHRRGRAAVRRRDPRLRRGRSTRARCPRRSSRCCSARPAWRRSASPSRALVKSADQAMPVAQLTFLPISFISGIWFPLDGAPDWLVKVVALLPALAHRQRVRRLLRARARPAAGSTATTCARSRSGPRSACSSRCAASAGSRSLRRMWFKSAVVYQIYPRSFADSDGDGIGDLRRDRRALGPPRGARRRRALALAGLPLAAGRRGLRHQRLPGHRAGVRDARAVRRAARRASTRAG